MLGFYSIRKLLEADKLSDDVANQNLRITAYPWMGKTVTRVNRGQYWELYDLEHGRPVMRSLMFLCHQVVHSYVFVVSFDERGCFEGILVTSQRERHRQLCLVRSLQIIDLYEQIGNDSISEMTLTFDESLQDYRVHSKRKTTPREIA
jgi:hypothetical protein